MINKVLILNFLCLITLLSKAQIYKTEPLDESIHSIKVLTNNDWQSYPIIRDSQSDYIYISFDQLSNESPARLRYRIIYCNADWSKNNELSSIEYLEGFDDNLIEDYRSSVNTTVNYTHYRLQIPNENVSLKLSGNYIIEVYDEADIEQTTLLTAGFSVLDNLVQIAPQVSTITDIDSNNEHHQVSFDLTYKMSLRNVKEDLKVFVRQNNRLDNERKNIQPNYIMPSKLRYTHNKDLIFEAGNEYHRFDMSSYRHNGKNVAHIVYRRPNYHMYIVPNRVNKNGSYSYDQDQNGRVIYRNSDTDNADTEGDYFYTYITLHSSEKFPFDIYVNGDFTYNRFTNMYRMKYDEENSEYNLTLLLKQGIYNYQLLTKNNNTYTTREIDGNFYETENEYSIYVYYRPAGQRYDSFVGFSNFQSRTK